MQIHFYKFAFTLYNNEAALSKASNVYDLEGEAGCIGLSTDFWIMMNDY